jgi:hypothetical protein
MAQPIKRTIKTDEVSQEINLREALGRFSQVPEIREAFVQAVIDRMVERTESSRDVTGKIFDKYSKAYKDSLEFKAFNKSNKVNMTLTGDMLGSIEKTSETRDKITVGVTGDENILKAFAHITGFEGHKYLDGKVKPRDFFGVTTKELNEIAARFEPVVDEGGNANDQKLVSRILSLLEPDNG